MLLATTSSAPADAIGVSSPPGFAPVHFATSGAQNQIATTSESPNTAAFFGLDVISRRKRRINLLFAATGTSRPSDLGKTPKPGHSARLVSVIDTAYLTGFLEITGKDIQFQFTLHIFPRLTWLFDFHFINPNRFRQPF